MWLLYNLLFPIGFLLLAPFYFWKMARRGNWRHGFGQRFGFYDADFRAKVGDGVDVWIQAVSVGEVGIARAMIGKLRERNPALRVLLTTTTSTGEAEAKKIASDNAAVAYFPLDWSPITARALRLFRPKLFVIVETEIWPNAIRLAKRGGTKAALVNGRISDKSFGNYSRLGFAFREIFGLLDLVLAQSEAEADRFVALGAGRERVRVVGQAKFDLGDAARVSSEVAWAALARCGAKQGRRIWVCGSTFAGEEEICLRVAKRLRERFPDLFLVLVPRHAERAAEVAASSKRVGVKLAARSVVEFGGMEDVDGLLVDTTGELRAFYETASVVFVGKSLTARGGQNPIEPAAAGKAIIVGPHTENFREIVEEFRKADAIVEVKDEAELAAEVARLLGDERRREDLGVRARRVVAEHRGALALTVEALAKRLE